MNKGVMNINNDLASLIGNSSHPGDEPYYRYFTNIFNQRFLSEFEKKNWTDDAILPEEEVVEYYTKRLAIGVSKRTYKLCFFMFRLIMLLKPEGLWNQGLVET